MVETPRFRQSSNLCAHNYDARADFGPFSSHGGDETGSTARGLTRCDSAFPAAGFRSADVIRDPVGVSAHLLRLPLCQSQTGQEIECLRRPHARQGQHANRRRGSGRSIADSRRGACVLRAGRKLSRRARRLPRPRPEDHGVPAGRRRLHDGGSRRQGDRPPGRVFRHPRARRHQCVRRHPHRAAGFVADGDVRRPGRPRDARARGVSGTRLPRRVRLDDQMGDRDRRSGPRAGDRVARVLHRGERPSRSGRRRAAGGHAGRARRGAGRAAVRAGRNLARSERDGGVRPDACRRKRADHAARRQPLVASRRRRHRPLCAEIFAAGRDHVPARFDIRPAASLLRRRSRHRSQSETARAHQVGGPRHHGRRPARRIAVAELHAVRYPASADAVHSRASGRRRAWPGL